jgi:hypothetical protein
MLARASILVLLRSRGAVCVFVHQVPLFGPRLPTETPVFDKGRDFTEFLYTKRSPLLLSLAPSSAITHC